MNLAADSLFLSHPDPMWIYDLETLRFLAVNNSAAVKYGYTREEFLAMTIADIRPDDDRPALERHVAAVTAGRDEAGGWRHCLKSGEVIYVDITGHTIIHEGRRAELIAARDISSLVIAERTAHEALAREKAARLASDKLAQQFQIMFDSVPGMFLVFHPKSFDVIAVSEDYLVTLGVSRREIVGRNLFDILPQQPDDPMHMRLRESFDSVVETSEPDLLQVQSFLLPRADGTKVVDERYWAMSNTPVTGPDGRPKHVMLRMQDVTEAIKSARFELPAQGASTLERSEFDLIAHTIGLRSDNLRLAEMATRLRITQRLLNTGTWVYLIEKDRLKWSNTVYGMYGVTVESFGHCFDDYVELVHPADRAAMRANFNAFMVSGESHFEFAHQVRHHDGRTVHVHGVAEKSESAEGPVLRGVVQDVTERVEAVRALARAKRMLEITGTSADFGAWRYDVLADRLEWSPQTARIHDKPIGFSPTIADAIAFYAPEYRDRIASMVQSCLDRGQPFGEILEIISGNGRRRWVRATGEAERDDAGRIIAIQGSFQDITELMMVRRRAEESEKLLEIAGRAVKVGGWSVSLADQRVVWTDGIAIIHELPPGTQPTFDGGIEYFSSEDREAARRVFEACATDGIPFDNVREVITAKGNRIQVRSLGEPVRDGTGKIIAVQGAMQDVSELIAARRQAEQMSQKILRTFESIRDGFFTVDTNWRFSLVNSEATRMVSMERAQLLGQVIWDVFPHLEASDFGINYKKARETGKAQRFVARSEDMDRWYDVAAFPSEEGLSIYFQDVTGRLLEQEQLRLLEAAVAHMNDLVVITEAGSSDGPENPRTVYVNNAFERLPGFSREEAIGKTPRILQGPKTQRAELDRIKAALATSTPVRAELINYTKSGHEYWLEIDIVPVANDTGSFTHFVAIERDITDRRRAEEALHISETRFRLVAEATGNAVWEWDIAGERQWWSEGMAEIFGHQPDPAGTLPTVWRANVHPDDEQRADEALNRLLSGQTDVMHEQYRFRRANGQWATVEDRAFLIRDNDGRAVRVLGSMTDISERLHLEERLRQSQKLEAVGQLTGGVAHDFNNLLTIIIGNTELLQDNLPTGHPLRQFADLSAMAADRAAELTNRLLAFSRKQALLPLVVDVNVVIAGLEGMLRRTLGEDIDIKIVCLEDLWRTEVDIGQLESALLNLAINSRDAMPKGGALTIETTNTSLDDAYVSTEPDLKAGEYVVIAVSDTGHGIPGEQIDRVFEPFFTTKGVGKGTGLGLSMVFGFVKQTGGHVRIYSEPDQGTTVKLYFPRFSADQIEIGHPIENGLPLGGRETILIVEDDSLIRQQLMLQLASLGYKVITASEGAPALAILRERSDIDLLLTDIVLPGGMNGRQIADTALAIRPGLRVLYTSGYSENAIVHHGRLDPGVELLSKPYRRAELASKIRRVLDPA
jgi:PAS domain S-box-containing protein